MGAEVLFAMITGALRPSCSIRSRTQMHLFCAGAGIVSFRRNGSVSRGKMHNLNRNRDQCNGFSNTRLTAVRWRRPAGD